MSEQENNYHTEILRVYTKLPVTDPHASPADVYHRQFTNPQSNFSINNYSALTEVERSALLAKFYNIQADNTLQRHPTREDLNGLGTGLYNLWLNVVVKDSLGQPLDLDPSEYIAWQRDGASMPPDVWAKQNNIEFVSQSERLTVAGENFNIEWHEGMRNIRGAIVRLLLNQDKAITGSSSFKMRKGRKYTTQMASLMCF